MPPLIQLDGVTKRWREAVGVARLDLEIAAGSFVVLLGPSGCGKSTTLRIVAGLETPDEGRVLIGGRDVTAEPPARRGLSMVFQSYALFPHLSVAENIVFGLKVRGVPKADRNVRLAKAIALTGLQGLERRKPAELSGGQRQRVALARAIIADHPICLMDEPLSNLDAKLRHSVRQHIRAMQRALGMTVLYVTHDQTEAMGMADRIVLMREGCIEQAGTPAEFYERPATIFAATFVGSPPMVILPADRVARHLVPTPENGAPLSQLMLGVRAEHLRIVPPRTGEPIFRVRSVEFLGAETLVYLAGDAGEVTVRVPGPAALEAGAPAGLSWALEDAHLFVRDGGHRVAAKPSQTCRGAIARPVGHAASA